ncbi:MAG: 2-hydroxychromene-2-carboxylate isomerase [Candidatus Binatia bacterium]
MHVDFWFEFGSTYSYPAAMRVEDEARARGATVRWRPFLLGPIFRSQGWTDSPFNIYPVKGRYMWRDLGRICAQQGLELRHPSRFPRNGLLAARLVARFEDQPWIASFVRAIYCANFAEDREISDPAVVASVLEAIKQDPSLIAQAETDEAKSRLRARTDEAGALGIFGAPSFVVDGELFWGNDRLESALEWVARGARSAPGTT